MQEALTQLKVLKLHEDAIIPTKQTSGSAGFDLHSLEDCKIAHNEHKLIRTGLAFQLQQGYELQIRSRSGLASKHKLVVLNQPGTIDSDYRGEVLVLLINFGNTFKIRKGDRIAQAVVSKLPEVELVEVFELSKTNRASNGFGSTGI